MICLEGSCTLLTLEPRASKQQKKLTMLRSRVLHFAVASVLTVGSVFVGAQPPEVYWHASPVAANESTLFAGSFGETPSVRLCAESSVDCSSWIPVELLDGWDHGVKFAMPRCPGGCHFQFCTSEAGPCVDVADPNTPDVWFAMAYPPLLGTTFSPVPTGGSILVNGPGAASHSLLRVFGRAIAFTGGPGDALTCIPATERQGVLSSTLTLNAATPPIATTKATCFEATFDIEAALVVAGAGPFPDAVLTTPMGVFALPLMVAPAPAPSPFTVIDVDADSGGNVSAALEQVRLERGWAGAGETGRR